VKRASGRAMSAAAVLCLATTAWSCTPTPAGLTKVTLMLDWVPNTNHTGLFVARERGYFAEAGLEVNIVQPGEVMAQQAVASGVAQFGVDFQEELTMARTQGVPLVSLAALLQHNTSGFASPAELGVKSPADWEGLRYGSFGSPFEEPTLRVLMGCSSADFSRLEVLNTGMADPLALLAAGQVDLGWIFYGWQGIQARQQGVDLNVVMMSDYASCVPDYYTPILITSEEMIATRPEVVRAFVGAVAKGYSEAISDPAGVATVLLAAAPELDPKLVEESQAWISPRYQAEAARWGEQSRQVWADYAGWMLDNGIIAAPLDVDAAFTNEFLPAAPSEP
jgi:ABC-type nitrate/sulfonate/bicarbonate transport system substrate-binding protein